MSDNTKKVSGIGTFAILSLYLVSMGFTVVTPAMATLAGHFEGKDVSWFSTLPTLFIVIGTFVAGQLMGKKLSCKSMAIIGTLISLIFGCAPALFDKLPPPDVFSVTLALYETTYCSPAPSGGKSS